MKIAVILVSVFALASCGGANPPDRRLGPLEAFEAAKFALRNKDALGFYDALGDESAMFLLRNTVLLCLGANGSEAAHLGLEPNPECLNVMEAYGWPDKVYDPIGTEELWVNLRSIMESRKLAAALDTEIRTSGSGSSFVWDHLEPVLIGESTVSGNEARADVSWSGVPGALRFVRDETGWRVETFAPDVQIE